MLSLRPEGEGGVGREGKRGMEHLEGGIGMCEGLGKESTSREEGATC